MSNPLASHPDAGVLLRYADGELPARKSRQVARHLEACWQCRTEIEDLQATVAECMRYRKAVLGAQLPAPPAPWGDLSRGFARVDESLAAGSFFDRFLRQAAVLRWSMAAAAALALAVGVFYELRETPSVQAATLLQRAVAASESRHPAARRVRFRSGSQQFVRAAGAAPGVLPRDMEAKFQAAHYDSGDPLSARAFRSWRDGEPRKQDEVSTVAAAPGESCYRIRTVAPEGEVATATLTLRVSDLVPVEGMLQFRDNQWIQFSEFTESPDRSSDAHVASNVEAPERLAVPPSRLAVVAPRPSASVSDELQVLSALHQIGADLGDPIQVSLSADKVLVSGTGVPAEQRQRIQRTLESMPNVAVQFTEPVAAPVPGGSAGSTPAPSGNTRASAPNSRMQARLEEQLGGPAEFERFSSQILDLDEAANARAFALRSLARRFPAAAETGLSAQDRRVLREIARQNADTLAGSLGTLEHALRPVLVSLGGGTAQPALSTQAAWQGSTEDLVRDTLRVQVLVSVLLGLAPGQSSNQLPSEVLSAMGELRNELDRCRQLLAQEGGG